MSSKVEQNFYRNLWKGKAENVYSNLSQRERLALSWINGGDRLLDLGCGRGLLALAVKDRFCEVYGCEIADNAAAWARNQGLMVFKANLNYEILPLYSECIDWITALDVIEHVFDPRSLIREVYRVLKTNGKIIISTPNIRQIKRLVVLAIKGKFPKTSDDKQGWDGGHVHYFTFKDVKQLLETSGFEILSSKGILFPEKYKFIKIILRSVLPGYLLREFIASGILIKARKIGKS